MGSISSTPHQVTTPTTGHVRTAGREAVQEASAFLRMHAAQGVRIAHLSSVTGISQRALRNAFHREVGLSPKQYDVRERLNGARQALLEDGDSNTVTTVATRFGFFELGRFARIYKDRFGESPSETRKRRRISPRSALRESFDECDG